MLTAEHLRAVLHYDPATGVFTWKIRCGPRGKPWTVAGTVNGEGYVVVGIDGGYYRAHRLAWLYVHGEWPAGRLDHEDTHRDHNWIDNLRPATQSQNMANASRYRNNASGYKGVCWHKRKRCWHAQIQVAGRKRHLGYFGVAADGHAAYRAAALKYLGEFARAE